MFDFAGLFRSDDTGIDLATSADATERPVDYTVFKDGTPFAILNATPALAARTVAGFVRTSPECRWSYRAA
ncbi:MAG: hypothetical protein ACM31L_10550 [Actinomycetota bacterium]